MRKHFLLLFLMSLLPLAGWATNYDVLVYAQNATLSFGQANPSTAEEKVSSGMLVFRCDETTLSDDVKKSIADLFTFSTTRTASSAVSAEGYDFTLSNPSSVSVTDESSNVYYIEVKASAAKFIVNKANLSSATIEITGSTALSASGKAEPAITVKVGSETLEKGTDYEVTYSNNATENLAQL